MKNIVYNQSLILKLAPQHRGVFSIQDLKNILSCADSVTLYRAIRSLEEHKILKNFVRGFYVTSQFDLHALSQRLCEKSYISFGNILAKELLIGSVPQYSVYAVKIGKNRRYKNPAGEVIHLGVAPQYFFGFTVNDGVAFADKEKAFLDTLYFYQKGFKFSFNVYQDIHVNLLDRQKTEKYLENYRNPKFVQFVKGVLNHGN